MNDLTGIPDEVVAEITRAAREDAINLQALSDYVCKLKDEAVRFRKESGIEQTWLECEEAYLGIDDANRGEWERAKWAKPMSMEGGLTKGGSSRDEIRATAFVRMTARYVDAGAAKVCEIAIPADGKTFTLKPSPLPELVELANDNTPAQQITGQPMPAADGTPVTVGELAKHVQGKADDRAENAAKQIHDWHVEGGHVAQLRKVIFDGARLGTGVLKGPVPEEMESIAVVKNGDQVGVEVVRKIQPVTKWVDLWRFFPAPGCGEDIHGGGYCVEMDVMLEAELFGLKESEGFLSDAVDRVIEQGPNKSKLEETNTTARADALNKVHQYDVWHFYGKVPAKAFRAANREQADQFGIDDRRRSVSAIVTVINDVVVRAVLSPLESGCLPFQVFRWSRRAGHWTGVGVAEQCKAPQSIVNGAWRRMLDNGGQSSGSQVVMNHQAVRPANGSLQVTPDKLWFLDESSGIDDVRKVFAAFQWPNTTAQLLSIIEAAGRLFEESTSIPLITQGQSGDTTPDTFSGQQLQDNNANQMLRDIGLDLNDDVTTPMLNQFYEWLLLDPNVPADMKGDFKVDTSGALALIEKKLQDMFLPTLLTMASNPAYELDPAKVMEELIRAKRMSPAHFKLTEEQLEKMRQAPPPQPPQVQAAQIRAEASLKAASMDRDRDTMHLQAQTERTAMERDATLEELKLRERIALLQYATQERISMQEAKVKLATDTMKLQAQMDLSGDGKGPQVASPAVEPEGRAPDGQAFQK